MKKKLDPTLAFYLNQINQTSLLTRAQEEDLLKKIEVFQKQIINNIIISNYSKFELFSHLRKLQATDEDILDISKYADLDASEDLLNTLRNKFALLVTALQTNDQATILMLLNEVALTGNVLHNVVSEIKRKYNIVLDIKSKQKNIVKYFTNFNIAEIQQLICNEDLQLYTLLKPYFDTTLRIQNKITEFKNTFTIINELTNELHGYTFADIQDAYLAISKYEEQVSTFKHELISKNLRLVVSRAKSHINKGLDFEDLIQEGNLGLMKAIDKFDLSKKTKISTYATWWIDQGIRRAISNKGKTVRVPTNIEWMQTGLAKLIQQLTGELKRAPTLEELAKASGYKLKVLEDLQLRPQHEMGIDEELSNGGTIADQLASDGSDDPYTLAEASLAREQIRNILSLLTPTQEKVIRLRYGIGEPNPTSIFYNIDQHTLEETAEKIFITKQGVRAAECIALKKLRRKFKTASL